MGLRRRLASARHVAQELRELGLQRTLFRIGWEARTRTGLQGRFARPPSPPRVAADWTKCLPFAAAADVTRSMNLPDEALESLVDRALDSTRGCIRCFGRWDADFGNPIDWHLNPTAGKRWSEDVFWSRVLKQRDAGDVKLTWEVGRFPQAYWMARAAAWRPEHAQALTAAFVSQVDSFLSANPYARGLHWASGQEIAFRLMAWLFALDVLEPPAEVATRITHALHQAAFHVEQHISYARHAVYNNHILSEALILYIAGTLLPEAPEASRWRRFGRALLDEQVPAQFYPDGGYIQQSHTYHRVALQVLSWAVVIARRSGDAPSPQWLSALRRSVDFLHAHQSPTDGRLPNYGANDGAQPSLWSTCDYTDFRPELQLANVLARGERLYPPGPWDEATAWVAGPEALEIPLRSPERRSSSFPHSGHHVLRGDREDTFATFRCGTLRDRFSQLDMLQLDLTWRGQEVLVDAGSYLYNGPPRWHRHFMATATHNTVTVDGADQMLHWRPFKVIYLTRAKLLRFEEGLVAGEHYGFKRHPGRAVHRRSVLRVSDDVWVVVDTIAGDGDHTLRLHWLAAPHPFVAAEALILETPAGPFRIQTFDLDARLLQGTVVAGDDEPPRGWLSRYYGEKVPTPSLAVEHHVQLPSGFITVLSGVDVKLERVGDHYRLTTPDREHRLRVQDGVATQDNERQA